MTDRHKHIWVANSGNGGEPVFRNNRCMGGEPVMHVKCSTCNARTWLTKSEWEKFTMWM